MTAEKTMARHAALVTRMAEAVGIDLEEKMMEGLLTTDEVGDAVLRCTGCTFPDECDGWLAAQGDVVDAPPDGCRNTQLFALLQKNQRG